MDIEAAKSKLQRIAELARLRRERIEAQPLPAPADGESQPAVEAPKPFIPSIPGYTASDIAEIEAATAPEAHGT